MVNKQEKENLKGVVKTLNESYYALEFFLKHNKNKDIPEVFISATQRLMNEIQLSRTSVCDIVYKAK